MICHTLKHSNTKEIQYGAQKRNIMLSNLVYQMRSNRSDKARSSSVVEKPRDLLCIISMHSRFSNPIKIIGKVGKFKEGQGNVQ